MDLFERYVSSTQQSVSEVVPHHENRNIFCFLVPTREVHSAVSRPFKSAFQNCTIKCFPSHHSARKGSRWSYLIDSRKRKLFLRVERTATLHHLDQAQVTGSFRRLNLPNTWNMCCCFLLYSFVWDDRILWSSKCVFFSRNAVKWVAQVKTAVRFKKFNARIPLRKKCWGFLFLAVNFLFKSCAE